MLKPYTILLFTMFICRQLNTQKCTWLAQKWMGKGRQGVVTTVVKYVLQSCRFALNASANQENSEEGAKFAQFPFNPATARYYTHTHIHIHTRIHSYTHTHTHSHTDTHTPAVQDKSFDLSDSSVQFVLHFGIFSNALRFSLSCHFIII